MSFLPKKSSGTSYLPPGTNHGEFNQNQGYEYPEIFGCVFTLFTEATQESLHHFAAPSSRRAGGLGDQKTYLSRPWFKEGGNEQNQEIHGGLSKRIFRIVEIYVRMYIILLYYIIHHKCLHAYGTGRIYTSIGDAIFRMLQSL